MATKETNNEFTKPIKNLIADQKYNTLIFNDFIKKVNIKQTEFFNKFNPFYTKK